MRVNLVERRVVSKVVAGLRLVILVNRSSMKNLPNDIMKAILVIVITERRESVETISRESRI